MTDTSSLAPSVGEPTPIVLAVTRWYARILLVAFALLPGYLIAYLHFFQDPALRFENHGFHEIAIGIATLEGIFVSYVTWQCYRRSGEPILRWLMLGFIGFVIVYAPHGMLTPLAHDDPWLFLLYGPASRLLMAVLLMVGLIAYRRSPDGEGQRVDRWFWSSWLITFVVIDLLVAALANTPWAGALATRLVLEGGALVVSLANVVCLFARRIHSPLMTLFAVSVGAFAFSSLAFLLGKPWNHMWWLAHAIFAAGFLLLSYGIVHAFRTTRSFSAIYSQEALIARLRESMARTEGVLQELRKTNQKVEGTSSVDPLVGTVNRRTFVEAIEREIERAKWGGLSFSVLALDLDNFTRVNDRFGRAVGDDVLRGIADICIDAIRPYNGVARAGSEELMLLVPHAAIDVALTLGERIRSDVQASIFESGSHRFSVTISIGIAQFAQDGATGEALMRVAEERLRRAKHHGRNCVIAV
ncbi:GGDEF domain-containing protein [Trinickia caryophylli]|uniref:diguanylate cyclase n=1 Tax=Trinickia caryophylli TaxID=28094 RepID=A0A1X7CZB7_TRICW|nr:GGDEF domain-containing protein [Trinickia caryophylli]PMS13514.1 GGDEF domain-containing protein [Trinickia caryophylli]TRX13628.1 GGDEF domain-containing protein [Trinickia caryophylli]WQE15206.1 GGDEF domain-containing protein [Trinickia caryophylli]SMF05846.1 diguanylate cyclase [Trinickia caryophylli]GLU31054.1 GGDEF domain-containing protein [Trinickia caryophylli]